MRQIAALVLTGMILLGILNMPMAWMVNFVVSVVIFFVTAPVWGLAVILYLLVAPFVMTFRNKTND